MRFFLTIFFLFWSACSMAVSTFPPDAITFHTERTVNGSFLILPASPRTILAVDLQASGTATGFTGTGVWLYCGAVIEANEIFETHVLPAELNIQTSIYCDQDIQIRVSGIGSGAAHAIITYVDRDIRDTPPIEDLIFVIGIVSLWAAGYRSGLMR